MRQLGRFVRELGGELPTILAGDLNSRTGSPEHEELQARLSWRSLHGYAVDHILFLNHRATEARATSHGLISRRSVSDHAALHVRLQLGRN
jgi:endonuclease/exonuclease/phosphatase family metal-dependent hydrolase